MSLKLRQHWLFLLLLMAISAFYLAGVSQVPFHPDESTLLYMSTEFDRLISQPFQTAWDESIDLTPTMRYRMIDAPLTRYMLGLGFSFLRLQPPLADWDWSASWEENQAAGALPNPGLLLVGRLLVASLFPLSLVLIYLIGLKLDGRLLGIMAVILFSTHPLILLHTRRAMAEGALIFTLLLALYALFAADRFPFLAGLACALALNAKHSAGLLLPAGLVAASWITFPVPERNRKIITNLLLFSLGFGLLIVLLNPFLWRSPVKAVQAAVSYRQDLVSQQVADFEDIAPSQVLSSPAQRVNVAIAQLYIAPPVFSEAGNYTQFTRPAEAVYSASAVNHLARGKLMGGIIMGFTLIGIYAFFRRLFSNDFLARRQVAILLLTFTLTCVGIILLVPLAWQRYYIPLIPFIALFAGMGVTLGIKTSLGLVAQGRWMSRLTQVLAQFAPDSWMT